MKKMKKRLLGGGGAILVVAALSLGFAAFAFASEGPFGNTLPGWQQNITVTSGSRNAGSDVAWVEVNSIDDGARAWLWCDEGWEGNRLTDSSEVWASNSYTLPYYNRNGGGVLLRGCTDGWTSPKYISGYVNFN